MAKLAILGSGSGSNMQSILDAIQQGSLEAEIVLVASDNPSGYILNRAQKANIPTCIIDCHGYKSKFPKAEQESLAQKLKDLEVDLICLAGFMRLVGPALLSEFPDRILNIHPSLLPNYPGLHAWEQAIDDQASESGCTVHYVDAGMDTGEIISQSKVLILPEDTPQTLHARIQIEEHQLYPTTISRVLKNLEE